MLRRNVYLVMITLGLQIILTSGCERMPGIKIGVILPLTGEMAKYGKTISIAGALAAEEINSKEGPRGIQLSLIFEDSKISPTVGVSAARKLIEADKVSAIIGPFASSVTLAVAPIAENSHIVLLSPGSSSPKITGAGDYIFRNVLSDVYEGSEIAKFAYENMGLRTVAVLYINNEFGVGLRDVFVEIFGKLGGRVVGAEAYEQGSTDFRGQLTKIHALSPEGIYLIGYQEMTLVFRQAKELGLKTQWLATTMLNDQSLVDKIGAGPGDGTVFAAWEFDPESPSPRIREFVAKFRSDSGMDPDVFAANTYDAIYLLYEAVKKRGSTSSDIRDGLYEIRDFNGVTGITTFDENGDVMKPLSFRTIKNGKIVPYAK